MRLRNKLLTAFLCAGFLAFSTAAMRKSTLPPNTIKQEWKGSYGDTITVVVADVTSSPHRQMQSLAESLSRVLASLPRNYDGYTVEWKPGAQGETGSFRITAWRKADKPEVRL